MSQVKIKEATNGAAQLSQGRFYLMTTKFKIKRGENIGKALIVVKMSELVSDRENPTVSLFHEIKTFLLTQKEFDAWLALLVQVSDKKLTDLKDGEKDEQQKKL